MSPRALATLLALACTPSQPAVPQPSPEPERLERRLVVLALCPLDHQPDAPLRVLGGHGNRFGEANVRWRRERQRAVRGVRREGWQRVGKFGANAS